MTDNSRSTPEFTQNTDPMTASSVQARPVTHYENFPVASWLCPRAIRPAVAALYHFARTADDIADEGTQTAAQRLLELDRYGEALLLADSSTPYPAAAPWHGIMQPLQAAIHQHQLPLSLLQDLLTAFRRDIHHSEQAAIYASHDDLLDYARYSANPVGRLMLHLYGVHDAVSLQQSDAICSALQLYNFWQDISVDVPRGRYYLPQDLCQAHGVDARRPAASPQPAIQALVAALLDRADDLMHTGMPLPATVSHQAGHLSGWELRLVMQGGWRIGRKTRALGGRIATQRPRIGKADAPALLWASLRHRLT